MENQEKNKERSTN